MTVIKVGDTIKSRNFPKDENDYYIGVVTYVDDKVLEFRSTQYVRGDRVIEENRQYITAVPNLFLSDWADGDRVTVI